MWFWKHKKTGAIVHGEDYIKAINSPYDITPSDFELAPDEANKHTHVVKLPERRVPTDGNIDGLVSMKLENEDFDTSSIFCDIASLAIDAISSAASSDSSSSSDISGGGGDFGGGGASGTW